MRKDRIERYQKFERLSPHGVLVVDENDELIDGAAKSEKGGECGFVRMILETLKIAGVQHGRPGLNFTVNEYSGGQVFAIPASPASVSPPVPASSFPP
jgi:hypothetical protein